MLDLSSAVQMENLSGQFAPTSDIFCFVGRDCSLRSMNNDESKVQEGVDYGKSFLKVSPKTTVYYII